jgi:hypothetical protein
MYAYHALQMAEFHFQSVIMGQTFSTPDSPNLLDQIIMLMDPTKEIYTKVRLNPQTSHIADLVKKSYNMLLDLPKHPEHRVGFQRQYCLLVFYCLV